MTALNKKYLIDTIFNFSEYTSEALLKIAVAYRFVHDNYLIEDHPLHEKLLVEEVELLAKLIKQIVRETNQIKKVLGFEYNKSEIEFGLVQMKI